MRKIFVMLISLFMLVVISCGDSSNQKAAKNITLIFATQDTSGNPTSLAMLTFAEKLAELSGGTMNVEFVNMTKYSSIPEMFEAMTVGTFDMAAAGYTEIRFSVPEIGILGYILKDFEHLERIMDSSFGKKLNNMMYEAGFVVSSPMYMGARRTTSNRPINSVDDFKGLKYRTTPTGTNFAAKMGTDYYPIAWSELPQALADGIVDAQDNALSLIESAELYKWQTHVAMTEHAFSCSGIFLSRAKYDTFTAEQKMWYNEAMTDCVEMCNEIVVENEATLLDKFINEYGMTVTYPDLDEIQSKLMPDANETIEAFGEELYNEAISVK